MEVVLPDGRLLRTGFGHYRDARTAEVYKWGVGTYLEFLRRAFPEPLETGRTLGDVFTGAPPEWLDPATR
jgi:hypothetical protein